MQAVRAVRNLLHQPKPVLIEKNPFVVPDRATLSMIRTRAEKIEAARRYWACPF